MSRLIHPTLFLQSSYDFAALNRFYGDAKARQLKIDVLKLILKIVLLYRQKIITSEEAAPARPKLLNMIDRIIDALEATSTQKHWKNVAHKTISDLVAVVREAHDAVMPLLQPNVREHNWRRLTHVFQSYGSAEFLAEFLGNEAYRGERESILANFKALVRPYETEMTDLKRFAVAQSMERRSKIERMTTSPSLRLWLDDGRGSDLFQEWLRSPACNNGGAVEEVGSPSCVHLVMFLRAIDYFRGTNNRALLRHRAEQVVDTYLLGVGKCKCPVPVRDDALRLKAISKLRDGTSTSRAVFDAIESDVTAQLNELFVTRFKSSEQFQALVEELNDISVQLSRQENIKAVHAGVSEEYEEDRGSVADRERSVGATNGLMALSLVEDGKTSAFLGSYESDDENDEDQKHILSEEN